MKSLLQDEKECYITGTKYGLHKHHIYSGSRRKASEEWGCFVWLLPRYHNMSDEGVHFNFNFDKRLKQHCQLAFEAQHGHEKFMDVFGKNYLED